jgi:cytochrome P450
MQLRDIDLTDVRLYTDGDAHLAWRTLRAEEPVFWQKRARGEGFWVVTRWSDVRRVLADYRAFTSERGTAISMLDSVDPSAGRMMQATDPPRQVALRRSLAAPLDGRSAEKQRARVRSLVEDTLRSLLEHETCDIAAAFSRLPVAVAAMLMGLPDRDIDDLKDLAYRALAPADPAFSIGSESLTASAGRIGLLRYFSNCVRDRRRKSSNDLVSHMLTAQVDGAYLSNEDVLLNCLSFMLGAVVTTSHAISATMLALAGSDGGEGRWPTQASLPDVVEEALRWASPITHFMRRARADTEIRETKIAQGDAVTAWIASANRDSAIFRTPDALDLTRKPNRHIAFGSGAHQCIGADMARLMLTESFAGLMRYVECFELAGEVRHLASNEIAGIVNLPLSIKVRRSTVQPRTALRQSTAQFPGQARTP